jgi:hypothetical protein
VGHFPLGMESEACLQLRALERLLAEFISQQEQEKSNAVNLAAARLVRRLLGNRSSQFLNDPFATIHRGTAAKALNYGSSNLEP